MKGFTGFPSDDGPSTGLPEAFFAELLPIIDHVGELKVTLYGLWRFARLTGDHRFLRRDDFAGDEDLLAGLATSPRQAQERLDDALERAVARGTFMRVEIEDDQGTQDLFFLNSPGGRASVEGLGSAWRPGEADGAGGALTLSHVRANVFVLYEQNIGPLTPMIAESLRDVMATYPGAWIEEAIHVAVRNNIRKLNYILAVLERRRAGSPRERIEKAPAEDPNRYTGYLKRDDL
jgi:hypothetical protein